MPQKFFKLSRAFFIFLAFGISQRFWELTISSQNLSHSSKLLVLRNVPEVFQSFQKFLKLFSSSRSFSLFLGTSQKCAKLSRIPWNSKKFSKFLCNPRSCQELFDTLQAVEASHYYFINLPEIPRMFPAIFATLQQFLKLCRSAWVFLAVFRAS